MEEYKQVKNHESYIVSNLGNVINLETGRILKQRFDRDGYKRLNLKGKIVNVHRITAIAFIPNPQNKPCVDHIDGNRANNNVSNLRWATYTENCRNSTLSKNNTTGIKGVKKIAENKYTAGITISRQVIHLGTFKTLEEAKEARQKKANEIFGEFTHSIEKVKQQLNNALSELEKLEIEFNKIV